MIHEFPRTAGKFYFLLFMVLWGLVCSPVYPAVQKPEIPVSTKQLYADVHALTSIQPPRNYRNFASLDRAADTIDTLDFSKMSEVVKGLYWTLINL